MNEDNALIRALKELNLSSFPKAVLELKAGIMADDGINTDILTKSVVSIKAASTVYKRPTMSQLIELYNKKLIAFRVSNMSCPDCHDSGWLKPILIEGKYQDYIKTYQVNYYTSLGPPSAPPADNALMSNVLVSNGPPCPSPPSGGRSRSRSCGWSR